MTNQPTIIPIASGKGGVGKSVITANLAIALAKAGHSTVAIDLDLGGSNLYSYLGIENTYAGIGDYLNSKQGKLDDYIVDTEFDNLRYLAGERRVTFMANIPHTQKQKLIREIKAIPAEYVLLDLGAGTTFNTLDYFEFSEQGIVVTTFEKPSIINTLSFLKNFIYRIILKESKKNYGISKAVEKTYKNTEGDELLLVSKLFELIGRMDEKLSNEIKEKCGKFHPVIIFNKGEHPDDMVIAEQIEKTVRKVLSVDVSFLGFVMFDNCIKQSTADEVVMLKEYPDCKAAKEVEKIADRIIKYHNKFIENSADLLYKSTVKSFEEVS